LISNAEPKASLVIIAEDATRIDPKTTTLCGDQDSSSNCCHVSARQTTTSHRKTTTSSPREVILFRNGTFISKEPIVKSSANTQHRQNHFLKHHHHPQSTATMLPSTAITGTGMQAAAQIVACNVLRQATLNDAYIENLIKREPTDDQQFYCYCNSSDSQSTSPIIDYENSSTLKILGCNAASIEQTPFLTPACSPQSSSSTTTTTTTTTIELITFQDQGDYKDFKDLIDRQLFLNNQDNMTIIKQEPKVQQYQQFLLPKTLQTVPTTIGITATRQ